MSTLTTTGLNTSNGGVKITPAGNSGKGAAAGAAQSMTKVYNPPAPRGKTPQTGA